MLTDLLMGWFHSDSSFMQIAQLPFLCLAQTVDFASKTIIFRSVLREEASFCVIRGYLQSHKYGTVSVCPQTLRFVHSDGV